MTMTNPRLEEIARRQMGPDIPAQGISKQSKITTITFPNNLEREPIRILTSDFLALEVVLNRDRESTLQYISAYMDASEIMALGTGIIQNGRLVKFFGTNRSLNKIPEEIGKLTAIEQLFLENNNLTSLPDSMENLSELFYLVLESNQLSSIPPCIKKLRKLQHLDLRKNPVQKIPGYLADLPDLITIYVNNGVGVPQSLKEKVHYFT